MCIGSAGNVFQQIKKCGLTIARQVSRNEIPPFDNLVFLNEFGKLGNLPNLPKRFIFYTKYLQPELKIF